MMNPVRAKRAAPGMSADEIIKATQALLKMPDPVSIPHVIGKASVQAYNEALLKGDRSKAKLGYEKGQVTIVEIPSGWHEGAIGEIERQIKGVVGRSLVSNRSTIFKSSTGGSSMEADGSWRIDADPPSPDSSSRSSSSSSSRASPTQPGELVLVLEVGYSQTLAHLHAGARRWLTETSAREVILVDISEDQRTLRGEIWRRDQQNPVQRVDFSNVAVPATQFLYVSVLNFFDNRLQNIPIALRGLPNNSIAIDLYHLQRAIRGRH